MADPRVEGKTAYKRGDDAGDCPYDSGSDEAGEWLDGYTEAEAEAQDDDPDAA